MDSSKKYENPSPELKANFISKMFFYWVVPFLRYGHKHDLEIKDIYNTVKADQSEPLGDKLEKLWLEEVKKAKNDNRKPSLKKVIFLGFYKIYILYGLTIFVQSLILTSAQPTVLSNYIRYFSTNQETYELGPLILTRKTAGWFLGIGVILCSFSSIWLFHFCNLASSRIGMRIRVACCSLLYRKLLRISQTSLQQTTTGQLVNLLSNDVQRFDTAAFFLHFIWIMPIQYVVASTIMYNSVGLATIAGMATVTCQALFIQGYLANVQGKLRSKTAQKTDYRVKIMNEIVAGIQVIKMYAWEKPFEKVVEIARKLEIKYITKSSYIKGFSLALLVFTERFILYIVLICTVFLGHRLTSDIVFSMAQLINVIQLYMCRFFPYGLINYAEVKVSIKRLENFLLLDENVNYPNADDGEKPQIETSGTGKINIQKANASWLPNPVVNTLIDINLIVPPGKLCCVVGNVGAGKSSLLQLILKELSLKTGRVEINGRVSYAAQEPWLFVSSVRNNILFGKTFVKEKYKEVVDVCALEKDFEQFPYNDKTLVGERGVSLSGGQRARINLARAVYTDADIYLLDDPLSAVDTHVGKHLFEKCIKNYLGDKTRILVTHQMQYLRDADIVVVINNGKIDSIGTYDELFQNVLQIIKEVDDKKDEQKIETIEHTEETAVLPEKVEKENDEPKETEELIGKGSLSGSMYWEYYRTGASVIMLIFLVLIFIIAQMASNACDLWVRHWTNVEEIRYSETTKKYLRQNEPSNLTEPTTTEPPIPSTTNVLVDAINYTFTVKYKTITATISRGTYAQQQMPFMAIYTIFILFCIVLVASRSILFYKICMNACKGLHNKMFGHILKTPMRFFDTNPSGRILNRFSKDIGCVDEILPPATLEAIQIFLVMIGIIFIVFIITPWMVFPTVFLGGLFYYFRLVYLSTAQDIKRIEGVTKAPVFSHLTASLNGLSTIRSAKAQRIVAKEFDVLQDQHTGSWYLFLACSEAFGFYLDVISNTFLAMVTLQFLVFRNDHGMSGDVGLVISSSLILSGMLQLGVRQTAEVASQMTSVERILQYTKLDKEEDLNPNATKVPDRNWPGAGKITFQKVYLRYVPDQAPVLKNLNVTIKAGEKVGIVGRTGAGKSTLISSLFRLSPIEGTIAIDDIDTSTVQLNHLRSNISIIPQEPVLFSASIRYNLDPFEIATDEAVWKALSDVELKNAVTSLEQTVSEGGSNFSVGQRQLVCLARAIVRNNKILVMDEATANVDPVTDSLIQKTIRDNFKYCTVLTIAHRLNTIMDCDKVLVMDSGEMVEFDHPYKLLDIQDGFFTKMVEQTGTTMAEYLKNIAKEAYVNGNFD